MFKLELIRPKVYRLHFERQYDLAMHFLRCQEYYESPKWYKQKFTLVDYMEWYSREHGDGVFTYPGDWSGFNIPNWVLGMMSQKHAIPDWNKYDAFMSSIYLHITNRVVGRFYLIGTWGDEKGTHKDGSVGVLDHELSHAYFYIHSDYKYDFFEAISKKSKEWPRYERAGSQILREMGYHHTVIEDELIAYATTGPSEELKSVAIPEIQAAGREFFDQFDKGIRKRAGEAKQARLESDAR